MEREPVTGSILPSEETAGATPAKAIDPASGVTICPRTNTIGADPTNTAPPVGVTTVTNYRERSLSNNTNCSSPRLNKIFTNNRWCCTRQTNCANRRSNKRIYDD
jgi:hypothetical protein